MTSPADRNLLVGILALQMEFTNKDQLLEAMQAWVMNKSRPLEDILVERGALRHDTRDLLVALVQKHLELHGGDPQKSLASFSSIGSAREQLKSIEDPQVEASLALVPSAADPYATVSHGHQTAESHRFRFLRPHAEGGLGRVSVAKDLELNREIALKEIRTQYAHDTEARSRFLVEGEITGGLEHPGIVPVYGLGQYADGRPFYAMRFIRGDSLKEAIERFHRSENADPAERSLQLRELLGRFVDVCHAIDYAHSRGVLHRDLKPGNIMLGKYGETLVVDWGLAKAMGTGKSAAVETTLKPASGSGGTPTVMGTAIGTPAFMSPEQAEGRFDVLGPATDVYGLGATLYALLTAKPPVVGKNAAEVLGRVRQGKFDRPRQIKPSIPAALEAICLRAMALKPEDRYASPAGIATDIEHWLADEVVAAYQEPWYARPRRWVRRNRTKAIAGAVVVFTLAISSATILWQRNQVQLERAIRRTAEANSETAEALARAAFAMQEKAEAEGQKNAIKAETAEYLRLRSEFESLLSEKPQGWIDRGQKILNSLGATTPSIANDAGWRNSAALQLKMGQELTQMHPNQGVGFPPGQLRFSSSGRYAVLSQFRGGAAAFNLELVLYDAETKDQLQRFLLPVAETSVTEGFSALLRGQRVQPEGINDVLVSDTLGVIVALTRKGKLAVWQLDDLSASPRIIDGQKERAPVRLLLDEAARNLFIVQHDLIEQIALDATEFNPQRSWDFAGRVKQAVWDSNSKRLLLAIGHSILAIDTDCPDQQLISIEVPAEQICMLPRQRLLLCAGDRSLRFFDANSLTVVDELPLANPSAPEFEITDVSVSFDGTYAALCIRQGEERWSELWSLAAGKQLSRIPRDDLSEPSFQFRPGGYELGRIENRGLSWWRVEQAAADRQIGLQANPIRSAQWAAGGSAFLISRDQIVGAWQQTAQGFERTAFFQVDSLANVTISPQGSYGAAYRLKAVGSGYLTPWQATQATSEFGRPQQRLIRVIEFDPTDAGRAYAVSLPEQRGQLFSAESIMQFSIPSWEELASWNDRGEASIVSGRGDILALECDGNHVFAGLRNGHVRRHAIDLTQLFANQKIVANGSGILSLAISPAVPTRQTDSQQIDGLKTKQLAVGTADGQVVLLNAETLEKIDELPAHAGACTCLFWPSDKVLISSGSDGVMRCMQLGEVVQELWRIRFPASVVVAGATADRILIAVEGERAVRSYPKRIFRYPREL